MILKHSENNHKPKLHITSLIGLMLIVAGLLSLLDLQLKTKWITLSIPVLLGLVLLIYGYISESKGWLISGALITGLGLGGFFALQQIHTIPLISRFGYLAMFFAASWLLIFAVLYLFYKHIAWWSLICTAIFGGTGYILLATRSSIFDFVFWIPLLLGGVFLIWGWNRKKIGLVIPGCVLATVGPGISIAWSKSTDPQGLIETGVMLVWFSLGWFLITVISRVLYKKFTWWPLIPGGVLAMVGWGLYIGGNPSNALGFVGNTGSIGLIIFGIYLLLLRFGMQK
jgi:hypothetical protein